RRGYYILDNDITSKPPRFIRIPDGKASSMASKAAESGRGNKGKQEEKTTSNMYKIPDIYGDVPVPPPEQVSKMYK
ncbi:17111_t:CDS:2, partial [Acaulospora morrowiae]